jgi:hypothetical protein
MMKKTLVALAAVAVTGGAFAQSVMTGSIGYGYVQSISNAGVVTGGMGTAAANISFAVTEDLGDGMSLSGSFGFDGGYEGKAVAGQDVKLGLKTASGVAVNFYSGVASHYLAGGLAGAGAAFDYGLDGLVVSSASGADSVSVSMPVMTGVTLSVTHAEPAASSYGAGAASANTQRYNSVNVAYAAGALAANVSYRSYDGQVAGSTASAAQKVRASASYDLGVAKIGAGMDTTTYVPGNVYTESLVGVTVPLGKLTLGAQFGQVGTTGYATNSDQTGSIVGAMYTLSKRTYMTAQYYSYTGSIKGSTGAVTSGTQNATGSIFTIYNSF